ncbi:hypothetical protein PN466_23875 [Roseofilum reptotaenium CS-1145]|uniref:Uncharacterized protein n=1 Tax=Roseofilum reptotaenium AO1-A TaxID=1925591 RepID=A0A1L9QYA8_9CYAN|nr:hypothetical protein [Roseofilum reptotaenium]MDB9519989.1 hypothetical protein [Roseofilum reptotaenium CS-1145]OJJ27602.1 hypothetical protein BI308_01145 [Roseofilum reptotaenium AO1-A]
MNAYKLTAILKEDGTLLLEGLPFEAGEAVEVIILEQSKELTVSPNSSGQYPLQGTVLHSHIPQPYSLLPIP